MKTETDVKAAGSQSQQEKPAASSLKIKSGVKAGGGTDERVSTNHNQTLARGVKPAKRIVALITLLAVAGLSVFGYVNNPPSQEAVAFAKTTNDLMLNELKAALFQEFDETTAANVEHGKQAISLIFNDANRDMRLIGVIPQLLGGANDLPTDSFEQRAVVRARRGEDTWSVERMDGRWYYRSSLALSNTFHPACVLCHTNFTPQFFQQTNNLGQWVGALTLRVPIRNEN